MSSETSENLPTEASMPAGAVYRKGRSAEAEVSGKTSDNFPIEGVPRRLTIDSMVGDSDPSVPFIIDVLGEVVSEWVRETGREEICRKFLWAWFVEDYRETAGQIAAPLKQALGKSADDLAKSLRGEIASYLSIHYRLAGLAPPVDMDGTVDQLLFAFPEIIDPQSRESGVELPAPEVPPAPSGKTPASSPVKSKGGNHSAPAGDNCSAMVWDIDEFISGLPDLGSLKRPKRTDGYFDGPHVRLANRRDLSAYTREDGRTIEQTRLDGAGLLIEGDRHGERYEAIEKPSTLFLPREIRTRHMLLVGPTGSGKTSKGIAAILKSDIADSRKTVVILEGKSGDVLPLVQRLNREYRGKDSPVLVVDFLHPEHSLGWNPLDGLEHEHDVYALAERWIAASETRVASFDSLFWSRGAEMLLGGFLASFQKDGKGATMRRAYEMSALSVRAIADYAARFPQIEGLRFFADYIKDSNSQNAYTIQADLHGRLVLFRDDRVAAVTSTSEVDLGKVLREPSVLVLRVGEASARRVKTLTNLFFSELVDRMFSLAETSQDGRLPVPVSVVIEEFASAVGRIPDMGRFLNTVRSRDVSVVASVQSLAQVREEYGEGAGSVMDGFCTKVFFPGISPEDATYASALCGSASVEYMEPTVHRDENSRFSGNYVSHESKKLVMRPLLTPHEIRSPLSHSVLGGAVTFNLPDVPPFQAFLTPAYRLVPFDRLWEEAKLMNKLGPAREALGLKPLEIPRLTQENGPSASSAILPAGITNTAGWTVDEVQQKLEEVKKSLDWENTQGSAQKWWRAFEEENRLNRLALVLRLAEELAIRKATITEFFLTYVYSNTDNIQANLHYLDYNRLKKSEEAKKRGAPPEPAKDVCDMEIEAVNLDDCVDDTRSTETEQ